MRHQKTEGGEVLVLYLVLVLSRSLSGPVWFWFCIWSCLVLVLSGSGPGSAGSVHQQLHLDQPGVGVPGHVVGNRPGEGDERSGLKAQLLFDQPTNRISFSC